MITLSDVSRTIVERLESSFPTPAIFDADEIGTWPESAIVQLLQRGLLILAPRAESVICDGCPEQCTKNVIVRALPNSRAVKAAIVCDEEPGLGLIGIAPERLQRYSTSVAVLARLLSATLGITPTRIGRQMPINLGRMRGPYGWRDVLLAYGDGMLWLMAGQQRERLTQIFKWSESGRHLDLKIIRRLLNRKQQAKRSARYQPDRTKQKTKSQRTISENRRIFKEAKRLKADTGESWTAISEMIVEMPFLNERKGRCGPLSAGRVRRIICDLRKV